MLNPLALINMIGDAPYSSFRTEGVPQYVGRDLLASVRAWRLWSLLAWHDLLRQYGRAWLGLFWVPLFTGLFVGAFTLIFSVLNGAPADTFGLYVASGYILWVFMSESLVEGSGTFKQNRAMLLDSLVPRSLPVFRLVQRNVLRLALNLMVLVAVFVVFTIPLQIGMFWAIPGLFVIITTTLLATFCCAVLGARFEDIRLVISIGMRLLFFLTPIMWKPERLGVYADYLVFNPFGHYIELVRAPLEGREISDLSLLVVTVCSLLALGAAAALFAFAHKRLVHWI